MHKDAFWGSRVVFFGEADHGKSSLMGYLYAESRNEDMDRIKRELEESLGSEYKDGYLYSSLINPIVPVAEGGLQRFSSKRRHLRDFVVKGPDPILITMIDTPGHAKYLRHQEYGASRGNIAVFCLYIGYVLDENFDASFVERRTRLWFAAHPNLKLIVALSQFDRKNYDEKAYAEAAAKIGRCVKPEKINAIVPIAIDFANRSGENILAPSARMPWYGGKTLIKAIQEQWYEIANMKNNEYLNPRNLVFSVDREYPRPLSNAGKIWRVYIENGELAAGDAVQMTSVEVKADVKSNAVSLARSISAVVKEFRFDVCVDENDDEDGDEDTACKGSAVTVNLKDCYYGNEKINKKLISTTPQTIGLSKNEPVSFVSKLSIYFESPEDVLWLKNENQEIVLLVFGRDITARIDKISDDEKMVAVEILSGKLIAVPDDERLRELEIFKRIIVRVPDGVDRVPTGGGGFRDEPRYAYLPARIDYGETFRR